ncbi:unnamed protein product, partial [Musa banksii]
ELASSCARHPFSGTRLCDPLPGTLALVGRAGLPDHVRQHRIQPRVVAVLSDKCGDAQGIHMISIPDGLAPGEDRNK